MFDAITERIYKTHVICHLFPLKFDGMTLAIKGRIGVTTLQTTLERSIKNMDWTIITNVIIAIATPATAIIGFIKYRYDVNKDMLYIRAHIEDESHNRYAPDWHLVRLAIYPSNTPVQCINIKAKEPIISGCEYAWDNRFKPKLVHFEGVSSFEISTHVPPDFASGAVSEYLFVKSSLTSSLKTLIVEYKRPHAIFKMTATVKIDTPVKTTERDIIIS